MKKDNTVKSTESKDPVSVAVCIPSYTSFPVPFVTSLVNLMMTAGKGKRLDLLIRPDIPIDKARNELVKAALDCGSKYIMFIDSDMIVPANAIDELLKMDCDIASGLYFEKSKPHYPSVRTYRNGQWFKVLDLDIGGIMDVDGVGAGCMLVKSDVFKSMSYPYFRFEYFDENYQTKQLSEDLVFCREAHKKGYKIFLNTNVRCGHIGGLVEADDYLFRKSERLAPAGNINTEEYWNAIWRKEGLDTTRTYKEKFDKIIGYLLMLEHVKNSDKKHKRNKESEAYRIADIGCGVGVLARRILNAVPNVEVHGIDISNYAVALCSEAEPRFRGWVGKFPESNPFVPDNGFEEGSFDAVIENEFLEHLDSSDLEKNLMEVSKMIKDKGHFICSVPNNNMPRSVCAEHVQDFTEESLRAILSKYFKVLKLEKVICSGWEFLLAFCQKSD